MSLVAYDASSDEDSDYGEEDVSKAKIVQKVTVKPKATATNGHISDEDDDFIPSAEEKDDKDSLNSLSKLLPRPKNDANIADILENFAKPTFTVLPTPKRVNAQLDIEEDDEFLHKEPMEEIIEKPIKNIEIKKTPVQIVIPSLKNFQDVEREMTNKIRNKTNAGYTKSGTSGLLSILPKAKSEQNFAKTTNTVGLENKNFSSSKTGMSVFVPDTVKHKRPATNTEDVDRVKRIKNNVRNQSSKALLHCNENPKSDESGDEDQNDNGDFFSFNVDQSLPEVSTTEINSLVAKKAAKIVETTAKYLNAVQAQTSTDTVDELKRDEQESTDSRKHTLQQQQLDPEALQALVGGSTKRRRQQQADIQFIDINSSQVLPNKDEWMRTALASSTTYQPTGVLVDEEPASGTRRKHQITYLAHKAKANEAELQAMWSANRQNRRATQSKYGF